MEDRLFGLDVQLLFDAFVLFVVIMIMYTIMSRLFFKPVRAFLEQAKSEASAIMEQADRETVSEKQRIKADVRKEMCGLALAMTGRFADQADPQRGEVLLEEALKEMGGEAWLN